MMLRPIDIQNKEFEKKIKGYDPEQVDDFLDKVIADYEKLLKDNQAMKDKLKVLGESLEHYKGIEATMNNALDVAKETAAGIVSNARTEAENIIMRAKLDSKNLAKQVDDEHMKKYNELRTLQDQIGAEKARIASICSSIMKLAGDM